MADEIKKDSLYEQYLIEINKDLELDRIILEEKQLKLPGIKGKWIGRLINHKKGIDNLWKLYNQAIKQVTEKIIKDSPVAISKPVAQKSAEEDELILKIRREIKDQERIVEYLDKMEKVFSSMTYDIRNVVDMIKQEIM